LNLIALFRWVGNGGVYGLFVEGRQKHTFDLAAKNKNILIDFLKTKNY
jgi:hypothetical protein